MRQFHLLSLSAALLALATGCDKKSEPAPPAPTAGAAKAEEQPRVEHGTNGEVLVHLEAEERSTIGLETTELATVKLAPEVKAYGRVLDITPLAALSAELTAGAAAVRASDAELARLKTLAAQDNASQRALQAAEAAATRDRAQLAAARLRLLAGWGPAIAEHKDLGELVASLGSLESALVKLDVPAGQTLASDPAAARLIGLDLTNTIPARVLGPAPAVDPQLQGRGFLCLVTPNTARLTPGRTLTGFLTLAGAERAGVLLPRAAIVRFNGFSWVYRQHDEDRFERVQVNLDTPLETGWFVTESVKPGEKVVSAGAQMLLSAEVNKPAEE